MASLYVNDAMWQKNLNDAFLMQMAMFAGFISASREPVEKEIPYDEIAEVMGGIVGRFSGLTPQARTEIKRGLSDLGISVTDAGVDHIYNGYLESLYNN